MEIRKRAAEAGAFGASLLGSSMQLSQTQLEINRIRANVLRRTAWVLGILGLIPFVGFALAIWIAPVSYHTAISQALLLYAVCIASFLGGIHWGIGLVFQDLPVVYVVSSLVWSVLPSLAAWPIALVAPVDGLLWMSFLLALVLAGDIRMFRHYILPGWFASLRTVLTVVACLSLISVWLALKN